MKFNLVCVLSFAALLGSMSVPGNALYNFQRKAEFQAISINFERVNQTNGPLSFESEDGGFAFCDNERKLMEFKRENETLSMMSSLKLPGGLNVVGAIETQAVPQWILWSYENFDSNSQDWNPSAFSTCGPSSDVFLGGHCKFSDTLTIRQYARLPPHKMVKLTGRVHYFDQWTGESLFLRMGNQIVWTQSWNWCPEIFSMECTKRGVDVCGHQYPDRLSLAFSVQLPHTEDTLDLAFGSTIKKGTDPCTVSYGVDDVGVQLLV